MNRLPGKRVYITSLLIMARPRFQTIQVCDPNGQSDLTRKLAQLTLSTATSLDDVPTQAKEKRFPGSGHFRPLIQMAEQDKYSQREVVGIVMFAAEGDNSGDAKELAGLVCESLNVSVTDWKSPKSWDGVFGEDLRRGAEDGLFW